MAHQSGGRHNNKLSSKQYCTYLYTVYMYTGRGIRACSGICNYNA